MMDEVGLHIYISVVLFWAKSKNNSVGLIKHTYLILCYITLGSGEYCTHLSLCRSDAMFVYEITCGHCAHVSGKAYVNVVIPLLSVMSYQATNA